MKYFKGIAAAGVAVFAVTVALGTAFSVRAEDRTTQTEAPDYSTTSKTETDTDGTTNDSATDTIANHRVAELKRAAERARAKAAAVKDRLEGKRLKACEAREAAIRRIMKRAGERGDNHIALFTKITERVQTFYQNKGKTLATYDQLVADVAAKKAAAMTAVDTVKAAEVQFDCTGDNPKALVTAFRSEIKAQVAAMKAYRMSVKNLIVGVKSVQATTSSDGV